MRLIGLPDSLEQLVNRWKTSPTGGSIQRLGQWTWNNYGQHGIDNKGWPELFYSDNETALAMLSAYYHG